MPEAEYRRARRAALARARYNPEQERTKQRLKYKRRVMRRVAETLAAWQPPAPRLVLPPGPAQAQPCGRCDREFFPRHGRKYCTDRCAAEAKLARDAARSSAKTLRARSFTAGYCNECGDAFVSPGQRIDIYCSARCFRRNRRRRDKQKRSKRIEAGARRETIDLARLAKRDGWRCHICNRKVTRKTWSHDHLIPLSAGGTHTWDNVALAHFLCNSIRGSDGHAQLLLIP